MSIGWILNTCSHTEENKRLANIKTRSTVKAVFKERLSIKTIL